MFSSIIHCSHVKTGQWSAFLWCSTRIEIIISDKQSSSISCYCIITMHLPSTITNVRKWKDKITLTLEVVRYFVRSPVTGEFPSQRSVTRNFDVSFNLCLMDDWVSTTHEAGDLGRHRGHYDVIVMEMFCEISSVMMFDDSITDVIMITIASQITSLTVVYSTVYSDADQRKHQSSVSLAFVWGIHRDRWIPRTKGQLRGKCFHLMTSSCHLESLIDKTLWRKMSKCLVTIVPVDGIKTL